MYKRNTSQKTEVFPKELAMEMWDYLLKVFVTAKLMFYLYMETVRFLNRTICKLIMV